MKLKLVVFLSAIALIFSSCSSNSGLSSAYNIARCDYEYHSISDLTLSGINLSNGISPLQVPKILSLLSGTSTSIPLDFTLNLDITNPNTTTAALNGLSYILDIDDVQFTTGKVNQKLNVQPGSTQQLPLVIGVDLATLLKGQSKTAVENIIKNFIGIGSEKSTVKLQIKPTFNVGNLPVTSPVYIPVSFSFGGK